MNVHKIKELEKQREVFIKRFSAERIRNMQKEEYALGMGETTFCRQFEYALKELGNNSGATAQKYGVWFGKLGKDTELKYRATKKFGDGDIDNIDVAFENVKSELISLISLIPGTKEAQGIISSSKFAPLVLGKVLYLYHPKEFIPIYSLDDMKFFIICLQGECEVDNDFLSLQEKLKQIKNNACKTMDNLEFSNWLYDTYYIDIEEVEDNKLRKVLNKNSSWNRTENFKGYKPSNKKNIKKIDGVEVYPRNPKVSKNALILANNECEVSKIHKSFLRKNTNVRYTEAHHLIPLKFHADFDTSLDVEANVVSLCSECHNKLHYGKNNKEILECLFKTHEQNLNESNIKISLKDLLEYYGE